MKIRKGIANPRLGSPLPRLTRQAARQSRLGKSETLFKSFLLRTLSFASEKPTSFSLRFQTLDLAMTGKILLQIKLYDLFADVESTYSTCLDDSTEGWLSNTRAARFISQFGTILFVTFYIFNCRFFNSSLFKHKY